MRNCDRRVSRQLKAFIQEVERLCRGKRGKGWARERDYLLRDAQAGRLDYAKARRAKMPIGSGTMESAIRRVVKASPSVSGSSPTRAAAGTV